MRLLKASIELIELLDGVEHNNNTVQSFRDINNNIVYPEAIKELEHIKPYLSQMTVIDSEIDYELTTKRAIELIVDRNADEIEQLLAQVTDPTAELTNRVDNLKLKIEEFKANI